MALGIYVHLPFCRTHCTYCAFAISTDLALQDDYASAVLAEVRSRSSDPGARIDSVYFGGGTPSRTSIENLRHIRDAIWDPGSEMRDLREFTIEANPEDITRESLESWRALGVDRVSIGVQSFHDRELVPLGRVHGAQAASDAVALVVASGVRTSIDLIAGLPDQTAESFAASVDEAVALGVGHMSIYMLDLEAKSPLEVQVARGRVTLPDDETIAAMYTSAIERLARGGFRQYEISNFAREGEESVHNLRYWRRGEYLGFGLGAHSFVGGERFANTRDIRAYIARSPDAVDFRERLGDDDVRRETIFLGLRQTTGVDYAELERLCGQEATEWMQRGLRDGWLERRGARVAFTPSGFLLSNEFISQLF